MKEIILTQGLTAKIDDADFDTVSRFKWCAHKQKRRFYAVRTVRKSEGGCTMIYLHRFLLPEIKAIDHEDGDGLNCQRDNLRSANKRQNAQALNRKREGASSKFRGVVWRPRLLKWTAQINFNGKQIYLGSFFSERWAAVAYDEAAEKYFGDFAAPNL